MCTRAYDEDAETEITSPRELQAALGEGAWIYRREGYDHVLDDADTCLCPINVPSTLLNHGKVVWIHDDGTVMFHERKGAA